MPNRFPNCCGNSTKRGNWPASRKRRRIATSWWKRPLGRRNSAPYWLHLQNRILPANSKSLGFPALVIVPKAALPNEPLGSFRGGVLLTLKTSARNSKLTRSDIRNVLPIIRSASWSPGPRTGFRELLPMLNCPAAVNADLSNHSAALRFAKSFGLLMRFGRCTAYPNADRVFVACVTGTASPAWTRTRPPISQPEILHHRGIRYIQPAEKTRGMSPLETSLSSFRLKASAAPIVVSVGPVKMV